MKDLKPLIEKLKKQVDKNIYEKDVVITDSEAQQILKILKWAENERIELKNKEKDIRWKSNNGD